MVDRAGRDLQIHGRVVALSRQESAVSSDDRVAELIAAGDSRGAATEVIRTHGPRILNYLRAILRDEDDAGDAFSLFAQWTWEAAAGFRSESLVRTWAYGIAWNAARRVRDEAYRRRRLPLATNAASRLAQEIRTASAVRRERDADRLEELRRELSADEQNLLVLRLDQGLEWEDIAAVLSQGGEAISAPALRKRFERLKERIARIARKRKLFE
jgi:RNA polymerase sigma-70 factor (ECF subfamily)